jgi:phytoene dehydrogenase-like protein
VRAKLQATPMTPSFLHLHLGIDATGLPPDLECHTTVINKWEPIDAPQNMAILSIPTTLDPSLAPPGHHVVHCYAAANEPYELWANLKPGSPEYEALKKERAEFLWQAVEKVIPDVRQRVKVELVGAWCAPRMGYMDGWVDD